MAAKRERLVVLEGMLDDYRQRGRYRPTEPGAVAPSSAGWPGTVQRGPASLVELAGHGPNSAGLSGSARRVSTPSIATDDSAQVGADMPGMDPCEPTPRAGPDYRFMCYNNSALFAVRSRTSC